MSSLNPSQFSTQWLNQVQQAVSQEFNGLNQREVAQKYDISMQDIYAIIRDADKDLLPNAKNLLMLIKVIPCPGPHVEGELSGAPVVGYIQNFGLNEASDNTISQVKAPGFSVCFNITPEDFDLIRAKHFNGSDSCSMYHPMVHFLPCRCSEPSTSGSGQNGHRKYQCGAEIRFEILRQTVKAQPSDELTGSGQEDSRSDADRQGVNLDVFKVIKNLRDYFRYCFAPKG